MLNPCKKGPKLNVSASTNVLLIVSKNDRTKLLCNKYEEEIKFLCADACNLHVSNHTYGDEYVVEIRVPKSKSAGMTTCDFCKHLPDRKFHSKHNGSSSTCPTLFLVDEHPFGASQLQEEKKSLLMSVSNPIKKKKKMPKLSKFIIFVEDNKIICRTIERMLKSIVNRVEEFDLTKHSEFVEHIVAKQPDMVILDNILIIPGSQATVLGTDLANQLKCCVDFNGCIVLSSASEVECDDKIVKMPKEMDFNSKIELIVDHLG